MPSKRRRPNTPKLVALNYGTAYCESCNTTIRAGEPVGWWRVPGRGGRLRWTAYCATCHHANLRAGHAIR